MKAKLPYTMLRDQIYTHPTISNAQHDVLTEKIKNKKVLL